MQLANRIPKKEKTIQFCSSNYLCTLAVKLIIKQQIAFLAIKTNMDITNKIVLFAALYWSKNFKLCNKHLWLFGRHVGLLTNKILVDKLLS